MFKKIFCYTALSICCAYALQATGPQTVAQTVLDRLYSTNGNYRFKKPKLVLSSANNKVAAYNPWKNTIFLDQKAYDICRDFGRDSLSALAYILGHELVHAYQAEIKSGRVQTNFLAYNHHYSADTRLEKVADIQGLFNGYLAGYGVLKVMPKVIEKVYREYGLMGKTLSGYPSLSERKNSSEAVLDIASKLCDVFESSNYLLVIGQYELATTGYEYILQYYQGAEIYNNLGIACVLSAQEYWNPTTDNYIYPLEADWSTKLSRSGSRGPDYKLDPGMEPLRAALLDKAENYFRTSVRLNSAYLTAHTNLVCVLNLKGNPVAALKYAELKLLKYVSGRKKRKGQEAEMAEIALGITYALLDGPRKIQAEGIFERLSGSSYRASSLYAQQNLQYLRNPRAPRNSSETEIVLPAAFRQAIRGMELGRTSQLERTTLDEKNGIRFAGQRGATSATFVFLNDRGNLVSLLKFSNKSLPGVSVLSGDEDLNRSAYSNLVAAKDGFYLRSPADKAVLKVDARGRVLEMVKYVEH